MKLCRYLEIMLVAVFLVTMPPLRIRALWVQEALLAEGLLEVAKLANKTHFLEIHKTIQLLLDLVVQMFLVVLAH